VVENESSQGGRRRLDGIPPLLVDSAVAKPTVQAEPAEAITATERAPGAPIEQLLRRENGQNVDEPNAHGHIVAQQRPDRRRMSGPSAASLEVEMASNPVEPAGPNTLGTETPAGSKPAVEPASTAPVARRRTGDSGAAAASAAPAERRRLGTAQPVKAPASPRATQAEAPAPRTPAVDPRPASPTGQGSSAPTTKDPAPQGQAPSGVRSGTVKGAVIVAGVVLVFLAIVLLSRWLRNLSGVEAFIAEYSGHASQPASAPAGIPGWLGWQHFLNIFFMVLIVRTGLQVRWERRPPGYWTPKKGSFFSPGRQAPKKISLSQWLHQSLDVLWVVNGFVFIILLFASGHWMRIVPTSWDVFPHMLSAGLQYASLDWPAENGWVHYNALQVMAYFVTVMIAAPLAILSGIRLSTWWPIQNETLSRLYPVEIARAVHIPVMIYFVVFTIVHVFLVFFTGALRNLNHLYTARDVIDFWGLVVFLASLVVIAIGWFMTSQMFVRPVAGRMGKVTKN
jgi:thiosulfate reductase cytochrome b subunit